MAQMLAGLREHSTSFRVQSLHFGYRASGCQFSRSVRWRRTRPGSGSLEVEPETIQCGAEEPFRADCDVMSECHADQMRDRSNETASNGSIAATASVP